MGDSCVAQWSEDGEWYRSKIVEIQGQQVSVVFTDYGNEGVTSLEQLKPSYALEEKEGWRQSLEEWYENEVFSEPYLEKEDNEDGSITIYKGKENV